MTGILGFFFTYIVRCDAYDRLFQNIVPKLDLFDQVPVEVCD